jgi:hypothetical protein
MRFTRSDHRRRQPGEPATTRPVRPSPGLAFLMLTSGCWMGGLNFAPLFWPEREAPPDRHGD